MRAQEDQLSWEVLEPMLQQLEAAIKKCDHQQLRDLLIQIVPGFKPQCKISDLLFSNK